MLLFPLISLSLTEDRQDKVHQGFYFDNQLAMKTSATISMTKCNPVEICLLPKIRNPSLDPSRLHEITHLEPLTMCLTHIIATELVKSSVTSLNIGFIMELLDVGNEHIIFLI